MIFGIKFKITKTEFEKRYGFAPEDKFGSVLNYLENLGLIINDSEEIKLTYKGRLFAEEVGRCFILN